MSRARLAAAVVLVAVAAAGAWWATRDRPLPYQPMGEPLPDAGTRVVDDGDLVDVTVVDPTIRVQLRYATPDNFLHRAVYTDGRARLRRAVAVRLARVQTALRARGLGLLVWDAYRPLAVQQEMWKLVPDPRYVADPAVGSKHNRGAAVDVTLVGADGSPARMCTAHDDFSERAAADAPCDEPARSNRATLRKAMESGGFRVMPTEWWHFDAPDWERYPIE